MPPLLCAVQVGVGSRDDVIEVERTADLPGRSQRGAWDHESGRRQGVHDGQELVSADASDERAGAEGVHKVSGHRADRRIASGVTLAVIDPLQVVDVTGEHRDVIAL